MLQGHSGLDAETKCLESFKKNPKIDLLFKKSMYIQKNGSGESVSCFPMSAAISVLLIVSRA